MVELELARHLVARHLVPPKAYRNPGPWSEQDLDKPLPGGRQGGA